MKKNEFNTMPVSRRLFLHPRALHPWRQRAWCHPREQCTGTCKQVQEARQEYFSCDVSPQM